MHNHVSQKRLRYRVMTPIIVHHMYHTSATGTVPPVCPKKWDAPISTEKLTDHRVRHATATDGRRVELWDTVLPGLGLRIAPGSSRRTDGTKTWFVRYRTAGLQRRQKLGTYPALGLAEARESARQIFVELGNGRDPAAEKHITAAKARIDRFGHVAEQFVNRYAKRQNRSWQETERILQRYVIPAWGLRPVEEITRRDVLDLLDGMVDRGTPVMAKQTHAAIRKLFYWAVDRGIIPASPCVRIPVPGKADERDRILSDDELGSVWRACDP
jgi:Arm domain-containing DNA-binding protein/integrase-like protein